MDAGVTITVVDSDDAYLGLEVVASNGRFAGSTRIFASLDGLDRLADCLAGFPASAVDERSFHFGTKDAGFAGGFVSFRVRTAGNLGRSVLEVEIVDDDQRYSTATASFIVPVEAAGVDRFVQSLRTAQSSRSGLARLAAP
jgi:hypothetical protein